MKSDLERHPEINIPAYDLGHLLRKLPAKGDVFVYKCDSAPVKYMAIYEDLPLSTAADIPEDALAKLAIQLFELAILQRT